MLIEYGILQLCILIAMYYFMGLMKTFLTIFVIFQILSFILNKFGLQFAVGQDIIHFFDSKKVIPNCIGYFVMEKTNASFKDYLLNKGIMNVRKLRQIPRKIFGFYLWQDVTSEQSIQQFSLVDDKFAHESDVINYCNKWAHEKIPHSKPQWEIRLLEDYTDTTSLLFVKFHHSFSDGVGILTLFTFLNDTSFCPKVIPQFKKISIWQKIMVAFFMPICFIMQYNVALFFKLKECNKIIHTPDRSNSGESRFLCTKTYDFGDLRKCYKQFENVTFNNYVMGLIGKSICDWYNKNGVQNPGDLIMTIPVNMKTLPDRVEDINMNNGTSTVTIHLPVVKDLKEAIYSAKKRFNKFYKLPTLLAALRLQSFFFYVPPGIGRAIYSFFTREIDIVLSNVSGARESIYLCNKKILDVTVFLGLFANINMNIVVNSYNQKVKVQITADKKQQMDPEQLKDLIEANLDKMILELKIE